MTRFVLTQIHDTLHVFLMNICVSKSKLKCCGMSPATCNSKVVHYYRVWRTCLRKPRTVILQKLNLAYQLSKSIDEIDCIEGCSTYFLSWLQEIYAWIWTMYILSEEASGRSGFRCSVSNYPSNKLVIICIYCRNSNCRRVIIEPSKPNFFILSLNGYCILCVTWGWGWKPRWLKALSFLPSTIDVMLMGWMVHNPQSTKLNFFLQTMLHLIFFSFSSYPNSNHQGPQR